jgi:hypothetical protein
MFECKICNIKFSTVFNFKKHLNSKKHKVNINSNNELNTKANTEQNNTPETIIKETNFKCNQCQKIFASNYSLKRHAKQCAVQDPNIESNTECNIRPDGNPANIHDNESKPEQEQRTNRIDEVPAHLRKLFRSKSDFYMTTLLFKYRMDLETFEEAHPELCNKKYKELIQNVSALNELRVANNTLFIMNGCDFDVTDYCDNIDEYLIKNNKECELHLLKVGAGHPSNKQPTTNQQTEN